MALTLADPSVGIGSGCPTQAGHQRHHHRIRRVQHVVRRAAGLMAVLKTTSSSKQPAPHWNGICNPEALVKLAELKSVARQETKYTAKVMNHSFHSGRTDARTPAIIWGQPGVQDPTKDQLLARQHQKPVRRRIQKIAVLHMYSIVWVLGGGGGGHRHSSNSASGWRCPAGVLSS
jgi:hypothetical protein